MAPNTSRERAVIAVHRFGLGEASLAVAGDDPAGWLLSQVGAAPPQHGAATPGTLEVLEVHAAATRERRERRTAAVDPRAFAERFRAIVVGDVRARLVTASTTSRPFAERLAGFWANHFTVSDLKAPARGLCGAFEREAVRPAIATTFETLLKACVKHAAMLRYLDNDRSAGPHSERVQRQARRAQGDDRPRVTGLNENLAREVLELHTLGVDGGYTQADVTAFAAVLTGWRSTESETTAGPLTQAVRFDPGWHEPGAKTVLGRRYPEGPEALDAVLHDLAAHPSTARFIATKLARHFAGDEPPPALVERLATTLRQTGGDLPAVYRTLVTSAEPWEPGWPKLKTPEEFVVSSARLLGAGEDAFTRTPDGGLSALGQRPQAAPSPAGWPDRAEEWLGPDAVWKRIEWATRAAQRAGRGVDARELAQQSLGAALSDSSRRQIERAADGPQALTLLLLAPEFQRR